MDFGNGLGLSFGTGDEDQRPDNEHPSINPTSTRGHGNGEPSSSASSIRESSQRDGNDPDRTPRPNTYQNQSQLPSFNTLQSSAPFRSTDFQSQTNSDSQWTLDSVPSQQYHSHHSQNQFDANDNSRTPTQAHINAQAHGSPPPNRELPAQTISHLQPRNYAQINAAQFQDQSLLSRPSSSSHPNPMHQQNIWHSEFQQHYRPSMEVSNPFRPHRNTPSHANGPPFRPLLTAQINGRGSVQNARNKQQVSTPQIFDQPQRIEFGRQDSIQTSSSSTNASYQQERDTRLGSSARNRYRQAMGSAHTTMISSATSQQNPTFQQAPPNVPPLMILPSQNYYPVPPILRSQRPPPLSIRQEFAPEEQGPTNDLVSQMQSNDANNQINPPFQRSSSQTSQLLWNRSLSQHEGRYSDSAVTTGWIQPPSLALHSPASGSRRIQSMSAAKQQSTQPQAPFQLYHSHQMLDVPKFPALSQIMPLLSTRSAPQGFGDPGDSGSDSDEGSVFEEKRPSSSVEQGVKNDKKQKEESDNEEVNHTRPVNTYPLPRQILQSQPKPFANPLKSSQSSSMLNQNATQPQNHLLPFQTGAPQHSRSHSSYENETQAHGQSSLLEASQLPAVHHQNPQHHRQIIPSSPVLPRLSYNNIHDQMQSQPQPHLHLPPLRPFQFLGSQGHPTPQVPQFSFPRPAHYTQIPQHPHPHRPPRPPHLAQLPHLTQLARPLSRFQDLNQFSYFSLRDVSSCSSSSSSSSSDPSSSDSEDEVSDEEMSQYPTWVRQVLTSGPEIDQNRQRKKEARHRAEMARKVRVLLGREKANWKNSGDRDIERGNKREREKKNGDGLDTEIDIDMDDGIADDEGTEKTSKKWKGKGKIADQSPEASKKKKKGKETPVKKSPEIDIRRWKGKGKEVEMELSIGNTTEPEIAQLMREALGPNQQPTEVPSTTHPPSATTSASLPILSEDELTALGIIPDTPPPDSDPEEELFPRTPTNQYPNTPCPFPGIFNAILLHPHILFELTLHFSPRQITTLYTLSSSFHNLINGHLTSIVKAYARYNYPVSYKIFPPHLYRNLYIPDPNYQRTPPSTSPQPQSPTPTPPLVPSLLYLHLLSHRHHTTRNILSLLARQGLRLPSTTALTLKKLWFTMDTSTSLLRTRLFHNRLFWTDTDLYNLQSFIVKLDMRFNDPTDGPGSDALRKLMLGQRGLTPLWRLLSRTGFRGYWELKRAMVRYEYIAYLPGAAPLPETGIFGVPASELGRGHLEGWGKGTKHLLRGDELVMRESVRRELGFKNHIMMMMLWGYVDYVTGENMLVGDGETYISDGEGEQDGWERERGGNGRKEWAGTGMSLGELEQVVRAGGEGGRR
ncbi:hypothetical protein ACMFMG_004110 [Clarireedia jacksonii]